MGGLACGDGNFADVAEELFVNFHVVDLGLHVHHFFAGGDGLDGVQVTDNALFAQNGDFVFEIGVAEVEADEEAVHL